MTAPTSISPYARAIIPGPRALPVVGKDLNTIRFFNDPIRTMRQHYETYGTISGAYREIASGEKGTVFAFGPEFNQQILSNPTQFQVAHVPDLHGGAATRLISGL